MGGLLLPCCRGGADGGRTGRCGASRPPGTVDRGTECSPDGVDGRASLLGASRLGVGEGAAEVGRGEGARDTGAGDEGLRGEGNLPAALAGLWGVAGGETGEDCALRAVAGRELGRAELHTGSLDGSGAVLLKAGFDPLRTKPEPLAPGRGDLDAALSFAPPESFAQPFLALPDFGRAVDGGRGPNLMPGPYPRLFSAFFTSGLFDLEKSVLLG